MHTPPMDDELTIKITTEFEGLGDVEAEQHTINTDVAETIRRLVTQNLRNRYEDIETNTEVKVLALKPPNVVVIEQRDKDDD